MGITMRQGEAGFTLIEVLVAFAIVALVLAGIYQALAGAFRGGNRAQEQERVPALARAHPESVRPRQPLAPGAEAGPHARRAHDDPPRAPGAPKPGHGAAAST